MDMKLSLNQYLGIFVERNFSLDIDVVKELNRLMETLNKLRHF